MATWCNNESPYFKLKTPDELKPRPVFSLAAPLLAAWAAALAAMFVVGSSLELEQLEALGIHRACAASSLVAVILGGEGAEQQGESRASLSDIASMAPSGIISKIRKIFAKTDEKEADTPSPREGRITFDSLRLKMARAMSNVNVFRSRDEWVVACTKARVGPGQIVPCVVNGLDIVIFASRDGTRLDAFANSCPHLGSPFDLATVERKPVVQEKGRSGDGTGDGCVDCIVCPVHQTAFEIQSGQVQGEWCPHPPILGSIMGYVKPKQSLVKFAVRLRGKNVEVRVSTSVDRVGLGDEGPTGPASSVRGDDGVYPARPSALSSTRSSIFRLRCACDPVTSGFSESRVTLQAANVVGNRLSPKIGQQMNNNNNNNNNNRRRGWSFALVR
ncbi:hypothetical protein THAOC_16945 [Thalassiosira oceanica]|uniref:Rieske domain-containing protein n=1 Tax=Thalassiosira oceanica TaxID=159749 RepID=K0SNB4_THAOC|nr:hypothetical protein THAOC_16945 [Thalassiosira oceanica]|eukprot:EJK62446.1 hypothetical protein THAOC_16945 [Thalassiosira oceanica]